MAYPSLLRLVSLFCAASCALTAHASPLAARAPPLVPHVNGASIDISPNADGAYPRLAQLSDGTFLSTYATTNNGVRQLTVSRSTDGGKTFSALGSIAEASGDLDNAFLLQRADGAVVAAYRNHDLDANRNPTYYRITASLSRDGGANWEFLTQIAERAAATDRKNGIWEPFLRLAADGQTLQVYYASENNNDDQDILMQTSTDGGQSWGNPSTVAGATTNGRDGMPGVAEYDGGIICIFETTEARNGKFWVKSVTSTDDGANWDNRSLVYGPSDTSRNAGAPQIVTTSQGTLVASFMTDEDATQTGWPDVGASFKIMTNTPGGEWGHKTEVSGIQSSWPGLFAKDDGTVLGCSGHSGEGSVCHEITFTDA
ncbi:glycoside hydrolase family 93 protein [Schizophyllum commune]